MELADRAQGVEAEDIEGQLATLDGIIGPDLSSPLDPTLAAMAISETAVLQGSVFVETNDGEILEIEKEIAFLSPFLQLGFDPDEPDTPILLQKVSADAMDRVCEYCRFHLAPGHSIKERKNFNKAFMKIDTARLCELASASHYLDLKSLIDLTCRALAKHIQGKNPEEIRETFNLPDDLTEEEKVAPIEFGTEDSRVRMLNSLYARKRKELAEAKLLEDGGGQRSTAPLEDTRSVDDLLSFIEGDDAAASPSKKKNANDGCSCVDDEGGLSRSAAKKKRDRRKRKEREAKALKQQQEAEAAAAAAATAAKAAAAGRRQATLQKSKATSAATMKGSRKNPSKSTRPVSGKGSGTGAPKGAFAYHPSCAHRRCR